MRKQRRKHKSCRREIGRRRRQLEEKEEKCLEERQQIAPHFCKVIAIAWYSGRMGDSDGEGGRSWGEALLGG